MKNEQLKQALEQAIVDSNEVKIKEVMQSVGISHVAANDLMVMCKNIIRNHPEYRLVKFVEPGQNPKTASLQECGVLTCCEYDNGSEECETRILRCLVNKAGGNSGAGSKTYRTTLPATWMKELGVTEADRELELTFDGEEIVIKKLKNRLTIGVQ